MSHGDDSDLDPFCVCVRVRGGRSEFPCVHAARHHVELRYPDDAVQGPLATRSFPFHRVFGPEARNGEVYAEAVAPYVTSALHGYDAACFAYGATGSGKTYTMGGDVATGVEGISSLATQALCAEGSGSLRVSASLVEVYNEKVRDLGGDPAIEHRSTDVVETPSGVTVRGVQEHPIASHAALDTLLHVGASRRTTAFTSCNHVSSRSHSVLALTLQRRGGDGTVRPSRLTFVDLAGSEKLAEALQGGDHAARRREGSTINKSLLALGYCLLLLSRGSPHVPYRDSILTRLLREALGGNTATVMIATVNPEGRAYEETLSTLKYASSARTITRGVHKNEPVRAPLRGSDAVNAMARHHHHDPAGAPCGRSGVQRGHDGVGGGSDAAEAARLRQQLRRLKLQLSVAERCNSLLGLHVPHPLGGPSCDDSPQPDTEAAVASLRRDVTRSLRSSERRLVSPRLSHKA